MRKKTIKKLIIIFVIIFLILIMILHLLKGKESEQNSVQYTQEDINIIKSDLEKYYVDKVTPRGMSRLYGQYNGMNEMNDLYRKLFLFVNYLPGISELAYKDNTQIVSYYNENKSDIKDNLGITKIEDFIEFLGYIKQQGYKGEKYEYCSIQTDTFKYVKGHLTFDIIFAFEGFENEFKLNVHFANSSTVDPIVFYTIVDENEEKTVEESNVIEQENIVIEENNNDGLENVQN